MNFRNDINGLRAIAVIAVVLFHFNVAGFSGGFVGVDIFFVISGYLMTKIIFSKLATDSFSLTQFYLARSRRIIPALAGLCGVLLLGLWWILPPSEMMQFARQVASSATFVSNILYWRESGYFDTASHEKWLLHTWSLSVEWQFYIVYPVVLLLLRKCFAAAHLRWLLLVAALASFALSAVLPSRWADAGFFLLPTRAWEMLAGGLIFLFPRRFSKLQALALELGGLALIVASILLLSPTAQWPGWQAIIPVAGAILLIYAARNESPVTGNKPMQFIGTISYSWYLWHWPVYVGLNYVDLNSEPLWLAIGIAGSVVLALGSYYLIEAPTRGAPKVTPKPVKASSGMGALTGYALLCSSVCALGIGVLLLQGVPARMDPIVVHADSEKSNRNPRQRECNVTVSANPKSPECVFGADPHKVSLVVIGDSHANATITAVAEAVASNDGGVLYLGADGCSYVQGLSTKFFPACAKYNAEIATLLDKNYPDIPVLVINRATASLLGPNEQVRPSLSYVGDTPSTHEQFAQLFKQSYVKTLCDVAADRAVYVLDPIPEMGVDVPQTLIRNQLFHRQTADIGVSLQEYYQRHQEIRALNRGLVQACGAKILDPVPYLCDDTMCWGSVDGRSRYYDDDHLSEYGNRQLVALFAQILTDRKKHLAN
ncbi:acyltransferase family protein [Cellvibrio fontiphilus]|uniref:Acyltransferase family protein n=1 Tax=Cellvibrio fontiphilus TaxID=1815559 RepID=A0ABV7FHL9_9GAMM